MTVVAIDGPAASGKSTTARRAARRLGYMHLDTGAMYRAVTLACLERHLPPRETGELAELLETLTVEFRPDENGGQQLLLNGRDVTAAIREPEISRQVSAYSALARVRERLVSWQREIGRRHDVVCEGRDIGTRVFPDARYKFFLVADLEVRAHRRLEELRAQGFNPTLESIIEELNARDREDSTREHSPLRQARDAITVDTTRLTVADQVEVIVNIVTHGKELRPNRRTNEGESDPA